jgi:branched-chain amino acid transport system substrate-binding protein
MKPLCGLLLAVLRIGYFGPDDASHPAGGTLWQGASLAFDEGAEEMRLIPAWDENPWTGGAKKVVRLVYDERVLALIGGIDGTSTHLAEQVVAKALLPLIDPASTDRTVNAAFVPWAFSLMPDDRGLMSALADSLLSGPERDSFLLVLATDHDSRIMKAEFLAALDRRRARPHRIVEFHTGKADFDVVETDARAIVVLAGAADSAAVVRQVRQSMLVYGGPAFGSRTFLRLAGSAAEGARFPNPLGPSSRAADFATRFTTRYGEPPDYAACHAYDAAEMLIAAIRRAGPDRTSIRDAIRDLSPWEGVSGLIRWDKLGRNDRRATIAEVRDGRPQPLP